MNVLVVSQNFSIGGLETHINTYYKALKEQVHFVFAFSNYKDNGYLEKAKIYKNLNLKYDITIQEFCDDVKKLVEIIKKEKIDVIHIHPYYSVFAPIFAANLTNTKLVYTYHGYGSINFISDINDTILFTFAVEARINKIFCVSSNVLEYFDAVHSHNTMFLPNLIYEEDFPPHKISNKKKWALISRLDTDRYPSIVKFIDMLKDLDIKKVDIYGTGDMEVKLNQYIKKKKLEKKVFLKGYINDLSKHLKGYTGTIGLGRVVQESLCMNYPSIFVGYDKVAGVITKDVYNKTKDINFVPAALDDISIEELQKQINDINKGEYDKYILRDDVIKDFGIQNAEKYQKELENLESNNLSVINKIYKDIKKLKNKNEYFYSSEKVFSILYQHLSYYDKNIYLKNILISNQKQFQLINRVNQLENQCESIVELNNKRLRNKLKRMIIRIYNLKRKK